jgi:hypothetical protein
MALNYDGRASSDPFDHSTDSQNGESAPTTRAGTVTFPF